MSRIGIYGPYSFCEATRCGVAVARAARQLGHTVSYLATQSRRRGIETAMDAMVCSDTETDFIKWCRQQDHVVWCGTHGRAIYKSRMSCDPKLTHTLIAFRQQLAERNRKLLAAYDNIICPSTTTALSIDRLQLGPRVLCVGWSGALPGIIDNAGLSLGDRAYAFCVPLESRTLHKILPQLLPPLVEMAKQQPLLRVLLLHTRRLSRTQSAMIAQARSLQIQNLADPSGEERRQAFRLSGWTVLPHSRPDSGYDAAEAIENGCPVIAPGIPPFCELVSDGSNGLHIPGSRRPISEWPNQPIWPQDLERLLEIWRRALGNVRLLSKLREKCLRAAPERAIQFRNVWKMVFGHG